MDMKMINKLTILPDSDPILRIPCSPVESVTPELQDLALSMTKTMVHANGIGLAGPQVGHSIQLIVMDTMYQEKFNGASAIMFNPEILHGEGLIRSKETCLSFSKTYSVEVDRFSKVKIKYLNIQNQSIIREFKGLAAIVLQHEIEHLQGILLSDHDNKEEVK